MNYYRLFGDPSLGLDLFLILIPVLLIIFTKKVKIENLLKIIGGVSISSYGLPKLSLILVNLGLPSFNITSSSTIYVVNWYFMLFAFGIMLIIYVIMQEIYNSPFGRALRAIREDDTSAISVGKSIFGFRLRALFLANALTGLAGAAFALLLSSVTPQTFLPLLTFQLYIMVII